MVSDFINELRERFKRYRDTSKLGNWLDNNFERAQSFINERAQTVIFGGMDDAFGWNSNLVDRHMYRVITTVAVINASLAASLERGSEHPLAEAIVRGAEERDVKMVDATDFEAITGKGVKGIVNGHNVALGNSKLVADMGLNGGSLSETANARRDEGETVMFVILDNNIAGLVSVADPVKETTPKALQELHQLGFRIIMATGDNERTAKAVAARLGIDEIRADVLPEDKANIIKELQKQGHKVAMAGDGVNDAPALAQADVGIAMGTGADVAIESAGFTLVKGDLDGIVRARRLVRATMRNIRQNLFFALAYNTAGVPVAAGVLFPFFGILISPMFAAFAMSASSISVVLNALRLRKESI